MNHTGKSDHTCGEVKITNETIIITQKPQISKQTKTPNHRGGHQGRFNAAKTSQKQTEIINNMKGLIPMNTIHEFKHLIP